METDNPFEATLDRLRDKGWTQNSFGPKNGPNCIYGAARAVMDTDSLEAFDLAIQTLVRLEFPDRMGKAPHSGVSLNDHPLTTFSDVERVLEKAAVKWEEERVTRDG